MPCREAARHADRRQAGEVRADRDDVHQAHLHRTGHPTAASSRRRRGGADGAPTGARRPATATPRLECRSFGANVCEARLDARDGAATSLAPERYLELLKQTGFASDVIWLQKG